MDKEPIPALFEQCIEVYDAMADKASMELAFPEDEEKSLVYEGFLTRLITEELHFSVPYYTKISRKLKEMGSIIQIRRGGSTSPSRWIVADRPTLELFKKAVPHTKVRKTRIDALEQQIRDLNDRMNKAGI